MINLRYHIVSITAVFLALGIGTALGGTFLDRYTVDVLDRNIRSAETRIRQTNERNEGLERQLNDAASRDESLIQVGSTRLFEDRLTDVPVLIVTQSGVDADVLANVRLSLARSGADLRGTLELRDGLDLADRVDADVAKVVSQPVSQPVKVRNAVNRALVRALFEAGRVPDKTEEPSGPTTTTVPGDVPPGTTVPGDLPPETTIPSTTTTTSPPVDRPDGAQPAIVTALLAKDYLRLTPGPGHDSSEPILETDGYRYVFLGTSTPTPRSNAVMLRMLPTAKANGLPAVIVDPTIDAGRADDATPTIVEQVLDDSERAAIYNTVDNVDTFAGLVATVFVLDEITTAEPGHYGQGAGATAILPGPS